MPYGKRIVCYTTRADLDLMFRDACATRPMQLVHGGLWDSPDVVYFDSFEDAPNVSYTIVLFIDKGLTIKVRPVPQRRGGVKYAIDEQLNPTSFRIVLGHVLLSGTEEYKTYLAAIREHARQMRMPFEDPPPIAFIANSQMGTTSRDPEVLSMFNLFKKCVKRHFTCPDRFHWIGPEAMALYKRGAKLL